MSRADADVARARDERIVAWQLGRSPRGAWRVAVRCSYGHPQVIETEPALASGEPFPTLYYLTCPYLGRAASEAESTGELARFDAAARADARFASEMRSAHEEVARRRAQLARGADPCAGAGVAGQRDPLATKCLHARIAAALAGVQDPAGRAMLERVGRECDDGRCDRKERDGG
ncbi:MAG: DUF501 domain-containing protein [Coriobacteriia bacterium]|nr:DUF501 domain-containing protein [Coriobacteriia bacterium]